MAGSVKICSKCLIEKLSSEFYNQCNSPDGLRYSCKKCSAVSKAKWIQSNVERTAKCRKEYLLKNKGNLALKSAQRWIAEKEKLTLQHKAWVLLNREYVAEYQRNWRQKNQIQSNAIAKKARDKNLPQRLANNGRRRAISKRATPVWANMFFIAEAYRLARLRTEVTGVKWEVDHIIPLRADLVCGLHAHTNIQVITKQANLTKRHWTWPDMPQGEA